MPSIRVKIFPGGDVQMEGENFQGSACDVMDRLTLTLGKTPGDMVTELKPEYAMVSQAQTEGLA